MQKLVELGHLARLHPQRDVGVLADLCKRVLADALALSFELLAAQLVVVVVVVVVIVIVIVVVVVVIAGSAFRLIVIVAVHDLLFELELAHDRIGVCLTHEGEV